jgi:stage II sporulation protein AA (anti-sigma F factor antagonist)
VALTAFDRDLEPFPFHVIVVEDRLGRRPSDQSVVVVLGELDLATVPRLRCVVSGEVEAGKSDLVVDLVGVEFIDLSGMRALLNFAEQAKDKGGRLRLQAPSRPVRRLLDLLGLHEHLPIKE